MCVASIAWDAHPHWLLVAIGNRDEYHERPSAPLGAWNDGSGILAGRDLRGGGTWLGVSEAGRFALVTNYRVPEGPQPGRPSRGALVTDLLTDRKPTQMAEMNAFNLIFAEPGGASFLSNHPEELALPLDPGIHGLSNGGFENVWPKTRQLNAALSKWLTDDARDVGQLFQALRDETAFPVGVSPEDGPEPSYSPIFIRNDVYGTRCSTIVAIARSGIGSIIERRFNPDGSDAGETAMHFRWPES
jgi:uncharacterized protein with NRDE domain